MEPPNDIAQVSLKVWGDYACFSRPEFKVERVSYSVMTPSAARGILEAVFWKPEFRYEIREIGVLRRGRPLSILRNELNERQGTKPLFIEDRRQQRTSLILADVAYLIRAAIVLREHATELVFKYRDQFDRRVRRGQCHHTPYLGTREFSAFFASPDEESVPEPLNEDLGHILFDVAFVPSTRRVELEFLRHGPNGPVPAKGYAQALFFSARLNNGWMKVPAVKYQELYRLEGSHVS